MTCSKPSAMALPKTWGALAAPCGAKTNAQVGLVGPAGMIWEGPTAFHVPLIMATSRLYTQRATHIYILYDITGLDVLEWKVYRTMMDGTRNGDAIYKIQTLVKRCPTFLASLLVFVELPDGDTAWYPWQSCNPMNLLSHTVIAEPRQCTLAEIGAHVRAIDKDSLRTPLAEHSSVCPVMPKQGYIVRSDLVDLKQRRVEAEAVRLAASLEAPVVAEPTTTGFETHFMGKLPPGSDDIEPTEEDRNMTTEEKMQLCNYDALVSGWSTEATRRFFMSYKLFVIRGDYRLPKLVKIITQRLAFGRDSLCCLFQDSDALVWVDAVALKSTRLILQGATTAIRALKNRRQTRKLNDALEIADNNADVIAKFVAGEDRPPSPDAWTEKEEYEATKISTQKSARELDKLREELRNAEAELYDCATQEVCQTSDISKLNPDQLDELRDKRYNTLKRTNTEYLQLMMRLRKLERASGKV